MIGRPATARRRDIRCPDCGGGRTVSLEQALRIARGEHTGKCSHCRKPPEIRVTEEHRLYWLNLAGVEPGRSSRAYVRANGMPDVLLPIAAGASYWPSV